MTVFENYLKENAQTYPTLTADQEQQLSQIFSAFQQSKERYVARRADFEKALDKIVEAVGQDTLLEPVEDYRNNRAYQHRESPFYRLDVLVNASRLLSKDPKESLFFQSYLFSYKEYALMNLIEINKAYSKDFVGSQDQELLAKSAEFLMCGVLADQATPTDGVLEEWLKNNESNRGLATAYYFAYMPTLASLLVSQAKQLGQVWGWSEDGLGFFNGEDFTSSGALTTTPMIGTTILNQSLSQLMADDPVLFERLDKAGVYRHYQSEGAIDIFDLSFIALSNLLEARPDVEARELKAIIELFLLNANDDTWQELANDLTDDEQLKLVIDHASTLSYDQLEQILLDAIKYQELVLEFFDGIVWQANYCLEMNAIQARLEHELVRDLLERIELAGYSEVTSHLLEIAMDKATIAQVIYRMTDTGNSVAVSGAEAKFLSNKWLEFSKAQQTHLPEVLDMTAQIGWGIADETLEVPETEVVQALMDTILDSLAVAVSPDMMVGASHEILE